MGMGAVLNFADLRETAPVRTVSWVVTVPVHFHTKQVFFEELPEQHKNKITYTQPPTSPASFYLAQFSVLLYFLLPEVALVCYIITCCFVSRLCLLLSLLPPRPWVQ